MLRRAEDMRAQSPLTGLPGNVRIEDEIEGRGARPRPFAILYVDLDHFKAFNDHYGFMRGDEAIQETAASSSRARGIAGATGSSATSAATTSC